MVVSSVGYKPEGDVVVKGEDEERLMFCLRKETLSRKGTADV